ncbi:SPASM domain-containing protein [Acidiplasma cupricumulans]|uniref:SPASM domain-containing protein n=1 Tax=Acidiplasma cupricumulans TaxID=312540 RepID=UPI00191BD73B|nr:SPASM domain-containing protein [Acidiplasma cupricumulans]
MAQNKLHGFRVPQDIFRLGVCVAHVDEDIIVDPAGYIYPCWAFTGNTKFAKGLLKSDGSVEIINRALLAKNASLAWKNDECKNCSYLPLCFGGCRFFLFWMENHLVQKSAERKHIKRQLILLKTLFNM